MVKGIIEKTHRISSKITKIKLFLSMCKFLKSDKYYEADGVITIRPKEKLDLIKYCFSQDLNSESSKRFNYILFILSYILKYKLYVMKYTMWQ